MQQLVGAVRDHRDTVLPAEPDGALVAHVADGFDLAVGMTREVAYQVRAPVAAADYADTDNTHVTSLSIALRRRGRNSTARRESS